MVCRYHVTCHSSRGAFASQQPHAEVSRVPFRNLTPRLPVERLQWTIRIRLDLLPALVRNIARHYTVVLIPDPKRILGYRDAAECQHLRYQLILRPRRSRFAVADILLRSSARRLEARKYFSLVTEPLGPSDCVNNQPHNRHTLDNATQLFPRPRLGLCRVTTP